MSLCEPANECDTVDLKFFKEIICKIFSLFYFIFFFALKSAWAVVIVTRDIVWFDLTGVQWSDVIKLFDEIQATINHHNP